MNNMIKLLECLHFRRKFFSDRSASWYEKRYDTILGRICIEADIDSEKIYIYCNDKTEKNSVISKQYVMTANRLKTLNYKMEGLK